MRMPTRQRDFGPLRLVTRERGSGLNPTAQGSQILSQSLWLLRHLVMRQHPGVNKRLETKSWIEENIITLDISGILYDVKPIEPIIFSDFQGITIKCLYHKNIKILDGHRFS